MIGNLLAVIGDKRDAVCTFFSESLAFYRSLAVPFSASYDAVGGNIQPLRFCAKSYDVF